MVVTEMRLHERIAELERELDQMTVEFIDVQDQLLALYDLTHAMRNRLSMSQTLQSLAREAARLLKAEGAVALLPPTLARYPAPFNAESALLHIAQQTVATREEFALGPMDALPAGITSLCCLPIPLRKNITAALLLINKPGGFAMPDIKLARTIAAQAGVQIENALLHEETVVQARLQAEMDLAREAQLQMLLPPPTHIPGLEVFAASHPASQVGGDFYDFVQVADRPLLFTVGDVAGKGFAAALVMAIIQTMANRAARFMPDPTPMQVIKRTNEDLYGDFTRLSTFATAFVGQYDSQDHLLRYANAGHAPVILCPKHMPAQLLEADGPPIGMLSQCLSQDIQIPFGSGDILVVATDGFSEARNPTDEMFGYERLLRLAEELRERPAALIGQRLFDAVRRFAAGRAQGDDQTLVVLKGKAHDD